MILLPLGRAAMSRAARRASGEEETRPGTVGGGSVPMARRERSDAFVRWAVRKAGWSSVVRKAGHTFGKRVGVRLFGKRDTRSESHTFGKRVGVRLFGKRDTRRGRAAAGPVTGLARIRSLRERSSDRGLRPNEIREATGSQRGRATSRQPECRKTKRCSYVPSIPSQILLSTPAWALSGNRRVARQLPARRAKSSASSSRRS
jgi:hypothetical protein